MSLVAIMLLLVVIGVFLYFIPMDANVKQIVIAVVAVIALVLVVRHLGLV